MAAFMSEQTFAFRIESKALLANDLHVRGFTGREVIGQMFSFDVEIIVPNRDGMNVADIVGTDVCLVIERDGLEVRRIFGMVAGVRDKLDPVANHRSYRLQIVPRAFRTRMIHAQDIFQDLTVPAIIQAKLGLVGLGVGDVELRLSASHAPREFVVQYRETDENFIARLCEHLGIGFFFEHDGGVDRMVFTDNEMGYPHLGDVSFGPSGGTGHVHALEADTRIIPKTYMVYDYNYRIPHVEIMGSVVSEQGYAGGVAEYGVHTKTPAESATLAQVRAEEYRGTQHVLLGESDLASFAAGFRVTVDEHPHLNDSTMLLVEVEHHGSQSVLGHGGNAGESTYRNVFRGVPVGFTYRPPRVTPKPRIHGLLTGVTEGLAGASGELPNIDAEGRYMVRFLFDMSPDERTKVSRPVRMAQPSAGIGHGLHFPLKPGIEVLIAFIDGDPDRPIIVGAVPNPITPSPVVAANATESVIRTGSGARIRFVG